MGKKSEPAETTIAVAEQATPETESTTLSTNVLSESKFLAIRPDSSLQEAFEANYAYGETMRFSDLIRVKTPSGGATRWTVEELEGEKQYDELVGAIVYYHPAGTLWPSNEMTEGVKPLLRSRDLRTADQVGDDYGDLNPDVVEEARIGTSPDGKGIYDWQKLAYNEWGTGKGGIGKRCKESRQICILREEDQFPLYVQVQVGSLKNVTTFFRKLPGAYWRFVIGFSLEKAKSSGGISYSMIKPRLVRKLSDAEALALKATYTDRLGGAMDEAAVEADAYEGDDETAF